MSVTYSVSPNAVPVQTTVKMASNAVLVIAASFETKQHYRGGLTAGM
jgi:hypothetical protein